MAGGLYPKGPMRRLRPLAKLLAFSLVGAVGCVAPQQEVVRDEGTVRLFGDTRVAGSYVSPSAYAHYIVAQLAALAGQHDDAAAELARAIAADGTSPYLR